MMSRHLLAALLAQAAHATDVYSLGDFKTRFAGLGDGFTDTAGNLDVTNKEITGSTAPSNDGVNDLWRWYRGVDSATQAAAQTVMHSRAVALGAELEFSQNMAFKTKYDTLLNSPTDTNMAAKIGYLYYFTADEMGTTQVNGADPTDDMKSLWKTYHSYSPARQAQLKKEVLFAPFNALFKTAWAGANAVAGNEVTDFAKAAKLLSRTMESPDGTNLYEGKITGKYWKAYQEKDRQQLLDIMLNGSPSITSVLA